MKHLNLLALLPLFFSCTNNQSTKNLNSDKLGLDTTNEIYYVASEDTSMNSAINIARKTISELDKALTIRNPSYSDFAVKKKFKTANGGGEHMWIAGISLVNGNYKGFINNDPESTQEIKYGDTVIVQKSEITDWMYLDNYILKGGYTIREIRNKLTNEDRIKMDKELGFRIED